MKGISRSAGWGDFYLIAGRGAKWWLLSFPRLPGVPRMLRSAKSAFTRVFDALCLCGVVRC
jgi:hypothetical protein